MKSVILTILLLTVWITAGAQTPAVADSTGRERSDSMWRHPVATPVAPDSADVARLEHKAFWRASAETVGMNLALWAFDRYIQKGHFAYISWETIKANFRHGFEWDNDHLSTNMFAHPYNGSIFYNAGRSNGFNYWQSTLFAIGGSAMWEMFMEREYPSTNDIIATPIGGAAIGEALYRTSDMVLDDRTAGWERFGRELAGFVISPMRGFTRIVTGRAWHRGATSGRRFGIPEVSVRFSLGARILAIHDRENLTLAGLTGRVNIEYGDRFDGTTRAPFDYFSFMLDADVMKDQPVLNRVEIMGRLLSKPLIDKPSTDLTIGLYQHFDFFDSDTVNDYKPNHLLAPCEVPYKFGTPASLGGGLQFRYIECDRWMIDAYAHVNAVIMGGILSDFYRYYHRNYNWGSGFSIKGGVEFRLPSKRLSAGIDARMYRLYTWNGRSSDPDLPPSHPDNIQGDRSNATFFNLSGHIDYRIYKRLGATFSVDWYRRYSTYPKRRLIMEDSTYGYVSVTSPLITSNQLGVKLMLTYDL